MLVAYCSVVDLFVQFLLLLLLFCVRVGFSLFSHHLHSPKYMCMSINDHERKKNVISTAKMIVVVAIAIVVVVVVVVAKITTKKVKEEFNIK